MEIKEVVQELNQFSDRLESTQREVGRILFLFLGQVDPKKHNAVIKEVRENKELKLHPQTVYECFNMVRKFPEMADINWKPLPNLSVGHYYQVAKYKLSSASAYVFLQTASDEKQSIRVMREAIRAAKDDMTFEEKEIKNLRKEISNLLKKVKDSETLSKIRDAIKEYVD